MKRTNRPLFPSEKPRLTSGGGKRYVVGIDNLYRDVAFSKGIMTPEELATSRSFGDVESKDKSRIASSTYNDAIKGKHDSRLEDEYLLTDQEKSMGWMGNYEDLYKRAADNQGNLSRVWNSARRFIPQTFYKTLHGGGSMTYSAINAVGHLFGADEDLVSIYDNSYLEWTKNKEKEWGDYFSVYQREGYNNTKSLWGKMAHNEFWTQDVADGLQYLTSAVIGGKVAGSLGASKAGQWASATTYSVVSEASSEAVESYAKIKQDLRGKKNPLTGKLYTDQEIKAKAEAAADGVWWQNAGLLSVTNAIQMKAFFPGAIASKSKKLAQQMMTGVAKAPEGATKMGFVKNFGKNVLSEGFVEENAQLVFSNMNERWASLGENHNITDYVGDWLGNIGSFLKGMTGQSLNKEEMEAATSIALGSVIGGFGAVKETFGEAKEAKSNYDQVKQITDSWKADLQLANGFFTSNIGSILDQDVDADGNTVYKKDSKGNYIINWDNAQKLLYQDIYDKKLFEEMTIATMKNDNLHAETVRSLGLARLMQKYYDIGLAMDNLKVGKDLFNEHLQNMLQNADKHGLDESKASDLKADADFYFGMWDKLSSKKVSPSKVISGETSTSFENVYRKALYLNEVRLHNLNKLKSQAQSDNDTEAVDQLDKLIEDQENYLNSIKKDKKGFFKRYQKEIIDPNLKRIQIEKNKSKILKGNLSSEKRKELERKNELLSYEIEENKKVEGSPSLEKNLDHFRADSYTSTEFDILENESTRVENSFGEKQKYFFELGNKALANSNISKQLEELDEIRKQLGQPDTAEKENLNLEEKQSSKLNEIFDNLKKNAHLLDESSKTVLEDLGKQVTDKLENVKNNKLDLQERKGQLQALVRALKLKLEQEQGSVKKNTDALFDFLTDVSGELTETKSFGSLSDIAVSLREGTIEPAQVDSVISEIIDLFESEADADTAVIYLELSLETHDSNLEVTEDNVYGVISTLIKQFVGQGNNLLVQDINKNEGTLEDIDTELKSLDKQESSLKKSQKKAESALQSYESEKSNKNLVKSMNPNELDNHMKRKVADQVVKIIQGEEKVADARPEVYYEGQRVINLKAQVQKMKRIFNQRKDLLSTKAFKGFMESLEKANDILDKLSKLVKQNEGNREAKQLKLTEEIHRQNSLKVGLDFNSSTNNYVVVDPDIFNSITAILGTDYISDLLNDVESISDLGVVSSIVIQQLKNSKTKDNKTVLANLKQKLYNIKKDIRNSIENNLKSLGLTNMFDDIYWINPNKALLGTLLFDVRAELKDLYKDDLIAENPLFIYQENRDINELISNVQSSTLISDELKSKILTLINTHLKYQRAFDFSNELESKYSYSEQFLEEDKILVDLIKNKTDSEQTIVPTGQQLNAIRQIIKSIKANKFSETIPSKVWTYLRGIAGTGKTKVVLNWVTKALNYTSEDIYSFSHNLKSSKSIAESTDSKVGSLEEFLNTDLTGKKLVVIDEVGFFNVDNMNKIRKKVTLENQNRKAKGETVLSIVALGDPSQITKSVYPEIESLTFNLGMTVVDPLTITYRSNVSSIGKLFNLFQRNPKKVKDITVTSNVAPGVKYDASNKTIGVQSGSNKQDLLDSLKSNKDSGRSKVIIVNTQEDKSKYLNESLVKEIDNIQVLTYDEVQGSTYEEVYIDIQEDGKSLNGNKFSSDSNSLRYNTAMYTAVSRAKSFVFINNPSFENVQDTELSSDKSKLDKSNEKALENFTNRHSREKELLTKHLLTDQEAKDISTVTSKDISKNENKESSNEVNDKEVDIIEDEVSNVETIDVKDIELDETEKDSMSESNNPVQGDLVDTQEDIETVTDDGDFILTLSNPESETVRMRLTAEGDKKGLPLVKPGSPVVFVRMKVRGDQVDTVALAQVQNEDGTFKQEWRQVGIISNKDRNSKFFSKYVKPFEDTNNGTVRLQSDGKLNISEKFIKYGTDNKATIVPYKNSPVVGQASLRSTQSLSYNYNPNKTKSKGFVSFLLNKLSRIYGNISQSNIKIKIYSEADLSLLRSQDSTARYEPRKGVPYLVITIPNPSGKGKVTQHVRLTPRKLNKNDILNGEFKGIGNFIKAFEGFHEKLDNKKLTLGNKYFNSIIKRMKVNFVKDESSSTPIFNDSSYTIDSLRKEIQDSSKDFIGLTEITDNDFKQIEEIAKSIIPLFYDYRNREKLYTKEEIDKALLQDSNLVFASLKEAGKGKSEDRFLLVLDGEVGQKGVKYEKEAKMVAGKGSAQLALNKIARAHTKGDVFNFRVVRGGIPMAKSLLANSANFGNYFLHLKQRVLQFAETGKISEDQIKNIKLISDMNVLESAFMSLGRSFGNLSKEELSTEMKEMKSQHSSNTITIDSLKSLFGDAAFDSEGNSSIQEKDGYISLPLQMNDIKSNGTVIQEGVNSIGSNLTKSNIDKLESMMGTRLESINESKVQIENSSTVDINQEAKKQQDLQVKLKQDLEDKQSELNKVEEEVSEKELEVQEINDLTEENTSEQQEKASALYNILYEEGLLNNNISNLYIDNKLEEFIKEASEVIERFKNKKVLEKEALQEELNTIEDNLGSTKLTLVREETLDGENVKVFRKNDGSTSYFIDYGDDLEEISKEEYTDLKMAEEDNRRTLVMEGDEMPLGEALTLKEANRLAKSLIPGLKTESLSWFESFINTISFGLLNNTTKEEVELKFVTRETLDALSKPGESLLGLYKNGIIYALKEFDSNSDTWTVKENVLRHEVFHKIYNEYLTPKERLKLRMSGKRIDPSTQAMSSIEFEEWLADSFQNYRKGKTSFTGRLKSFMSNILSIFNFTKNNSDAIDQLFLDITSGKFKKNRSIFTDVVSRRTLNQIKDIYGSIENLKNGINEIRSLFNLYLNSEDEVYSYNDLYNKVKQEIISTSLRISNLRSPESILKLKELERKAASGNRKDVRKYESYKRSRTRLLNKASVYSGLAKYTPKTEKFDMTGYDQLIEWLFPNGTKHSSDKYLEFTEVSENLYEDLDLEVKDIIESFNLQETIQESNKVNHETKLSSVVKMMLSAVKYKNKDGKDKYMPARAAFVRMLDLMEGLTFSGESSFLEQFKEAALNASQAKSTEDSVWKTGVIRGLYDKVESLYSKASNRSYKDADGVYYELPDNMEFIDDNTFVMSISNDKGEYISSSELNKMTKEDIFKAAQEQKVVILNKDSVINAIKKSSNYDGHLLTTNDFIKTVAVKFNIPYNQVVALWKHEDAKNTLREFASHFTSLREVDIKVMEIENEFGRKTIRYISGRGLTSKHSLRSNITEGISNYFSDLAESNTLKEGVKEKKDEKGNLVFKATTKEQGAYKEFLRNYTRLGLDEKLTSVSRAEQVQGIRELLTMMGLGRLAGEPLPLSSETSQLATDLNYFFTKHMNKYGEAILQFDDKFLEGAGLSEEGITDDDLKEAFIGFTLKRTIEDIFDSEGSVFDKLASALDFNNEWTRATSVRNSNGDTVFVKTTSTQADDILSTLSKISNKAFKGSSGNRKTLRLPEFLTTNFFKNNVFVKGINKIYGITNPDGFKDLRTNNSIPYTRETQTDWFSRNFNATFLGAIRKSKGQKVTYDQSIYTTSNRPGIRHVTTNVLNEDQIVNALDSYIDQVLSRPYSLLQRVEEDSQGNKIKKGIKNFKLNKSINFEVFNTALEEVTGNSVYASVEDFKTVVSKNRKSLVSAMNNQLNNLAKETAQEMVDMKLDITSDANYAIKKLAKHLKLDAKELALPSKTKKGKNYISSFRRNSASGEMQYTLTAEQLEPIVKIWFKNHYINSYFINQLVAGDSNFFKNSLDQVKRMSGVFAPGLKGLVNDKFGMPKKFRAAIMKDVWGSSASIQDFLSRMLFSSTFNDLKEKYEELKDKDTLNKDESNIVKSYQEIEELMIKYGGDYEMTDAQGFITPKRAKDFEKGFGRAYGVGRVFKGAHYEIVKSIDENGEEVARPVMIKYSTVVLSDDLVDKYKVLRTIREKMENQEIDEAVFVSGTKVGSDVRLTDGNLIGQDNEYSFDENSVVSLSNEHYRLQSNPDHVVDPKADKQKGVANPTQLGYFLNVLQELVTENFDPASEVYDKVSKIVDIGAKEFFSKFKRKGKIDRKRFLSTIKSMLTGAGNERALELVEDGVDYNAPHLVNKIYTQLASALADSSVQIRFPGQKLTLQSSYGIDATSNVDSDTKTKAKELQYYVDSNGGLVAEVIVPSGILPENILNRIKKGEDVYMHADAMGFRIPSTELHSAVSLKIVDTYDNRGTTMVIAPKELVPLHGSDFDVDSLFILTRAHNSYTNKQKNLLDKYGMDPFDYVDNSPVGYITNSKGVFVPSKSFPKSLSFTRSQISSDTDLSVKEKVQMYKLLNKMEKDFYKNLILDAYLKATTHPENRKRMLSPITMEMFSGGKGKDGMYGEGTIFRLIQDINIKRDRSRGIYSEKSKDIQEVVDLSDPRGNYKVYKSNMEGRSLTGVFANAIKSMAYMIKSGLSDSTVYSKQNKEFNKSIEKLEKRISTINKKLEEETQPDVINKLQAELNSSEAEIQRLNIEIQKNQEIIDNLKSNYGKGRTANTPSLKVDESGNVVNEINLLGKKFNTMSEFMYDKEGNVTDTPIWEVMDSLVNAAIDNVKEQILPAINANGQTANAISAMLSLGIPMEAIVLLIKQPSIVNLDSKKSKEIAISNMKKNLLSKLEITEDQFTPVNLTFDTLKESLINAPINPRAFTEDNLNINTSEGLDSYTAVQLSILLEYEKAVKIGEDIASLSGALNIIRQAPAFKWDYDSIKSSWDKVFKLNQETNELEYTGKFSFDIPNLLKSNPHIEIAYKYLIQEFGELIHQAFVKHRRHFEEGIYKVYNQVKVALDPSVSKRKTKLVDEFGKFIFTGIDRLQLSEITDAVYEYTNWKGDTAYKTGHEAWSQQFLNKIIELKKLSELKNNRFIQSLDIRKNKFTKQYSVRFTAGSNLEYHDMLELQDDFKQLSKYLYNNDTSSFEVKDMIHEGQYTQIQHDFVKYAIINFGMNFSTLNYSMSLPGSLIRPYVNDMVELFKQQVDLQKQRQNEEGNTESYYPYEDLTEMFEIQLALNYASDLPFVSQKPIKNNVTIIDDIEQRSYKTVRSAGYDSVTDLYYDLSFSTKERSFSDYPKFMQRTNFTTGNPVVYYKLPDSDGNRVLYKKVGYGRRKPSYFLPKEFINKKYPIDNYISGVVPEVQVESLEDNLVSIPDSIYTNELVGTVIALKTSDDHLRTKLRYVKISEVESTEVQRNKDFIFKNITVKVESLSQQEAVQYLKLLNSEKNVSLEYHPNDKGFSDSLSSLTNFSTPVELEKVKNGESVNALDVLNNIMTEGSVTGKRMASILYQFKDQISQIKVSSGDNKGKNVAGYYKPNTKDIYLNRHAFNNNFQEETFLHELMHALTYTLLRTDNSKLDSEQIKGKRRLLKLYNATKSRVLKDPKLKEKFGYAVTNLDEFIVATYSRPDFQDYLYKLKTISTVENSKPKNFLRRFFDGVLNLFKIKDTNNVLVEAMSSTLSLLGDGSKVFDFSDIKRTGSVINLEISDRKSKDLSNKIFNDSTKTQVALDSAGNQLDHYIKEGSTRKLKRISDKDTGFISNFTKRKASDIGKDWVQIKADRVYQGLGEEETLYIEKKNRTKEEYIDFLRNTEKKGILKGNIIHTKAEILTHNEYSRDSINDLNKKLVGYYNSSTQRKIDTIYNWVDKTFPILFNKMGFNFYKENMPLDKALSEVTISSDILGYAGTTDMLVEHEDGAYSIVDWKTGRSYENEVQSQLLKYGDTFSFIYDNPKNKAKLQVMMYAFMLKVEYPDINFRELMTAWVPNEYLALDPNSISRVEIDSYLSIIEQFYKSSDNKKKYEAIIQKSPNAFKVSSYNGTRQSLENSLQNDSTDSSNKIEQLRQNMKQLIQGQLDSDKLTADERKELNTLFKEVLDIAYDGGYDLESWKDDIGLFAEYLGNNSTVNHPAIKLYYQELEKARDKARKEYNSKFAKFQQLLKPIYEDYLAKEGGIGGLTKNIKLLNINTKLNNVNYNKLYNFMYMTEKSQGVDIQRIITKNDEEYHDLNENQKRLVDYVNETFGEFFVGENALMNQVAVKRGTKVMTNLDLFNSEVKDQLSKFEYKEGFLPTIPITDGDIVARHGARALGKRFQHWKNQNLTFYYENQYEQWESEIQAIPVRYLGSRAIRSQQAYTTNMEIIFDRFMKSMLHKKYADDVHAFGRTLQIYLEDTKGHKNSKGLLNYLDKHISMEVLGKTQQNLRLGRKGIRGPKKRGKETRINAGKIIDLMNDYTSSTVMWFRPVSGVRNGAMAMGISFRRALSNSVALWGSKMFGGNITVDDLDYTFKNFGESILVAGADSILNHAFTGTINQSKTWQMMKHLGYAPDLHHLFGQNEEMMSIRNQLFSQDTAYLFHSLPEELTASTTMVAQLKSIKFNMPDNKEWHGKSMWDAYTLVNDESGYRMEYRGPVRGKVKNKETGKFEDLTGLTVEETAKLKYVYQEMHGSYRTDERSGLEFYFLGRAVLKFKKYLPMMVHNAFHSKAKVRALGKYEPLIDKNGKVITQDGKPVMEWIEEVQEGRWIVAAKVIANYLGATTKLTGLHKAPYIGTLVGQMSNEQYNWSNLSKRDRLNLIEGMITIGSMMAAWFAIAQIDGDEDDIYLKSMKMIVDNYSQQWNLREMMKNTMYAPLPASFAKVYKAFDSASKYGLSLLTMSEIAPGLFGVPEDALGSDDTIKGAHQFLKSVPLLSSAYTFLLDLGELGVTEDGGLSPFKTFGGR